MKRGVGREGRGEGRGGEGERGEEIGDQSRRVEEPSIVCYKALYN